ncbi:hypothetical protein KFK09_014652 [Dendrobium nobile]|uniref:Uncharacterized protein n=1 Tax=Dendrobium nobile TaxID=94219 RepID=A0A8T3B2N7_DENNO|nr:hypothetical protein KFK09_014652 [Dendrobium nobile]
MLPSLASPPSPSALLLESAAGDVSRSRPARPMVACCSGQRSSASIPKLEPFSRSRIDRRLKDPPFLQKSEDELTVTLFCKLFPFQFTAQLAGDKAYSCWMAYFELKDLQKTVRKLPQTKPKSLSHVNSAIFTGRKCQESKWRSCKEAGGVKSTYGCLHGLTAMLKKDSKDQKKYVAGKSKAEKKETAFHVPDGIPKTKQEWRRREWEMADSSFTRLLRAWQGHLLGILELQIMKLVEFCFQRGTIKALL